MPRRDVGAVGRTDQRAQQADHVENLMQPALIEGVNLDALADEFRDDVGLEIGKAQDEIGSQGKSWECPPR